MSKPVASLLLCLAASLPAFPSTAPAFAKADLVVNCAHVSTNFQKEISDDCRSLPEWITKALIKHGYHIALSRTITDAVPSAAGQQIRGYKASATWNSVFGMFNRSTRTVIMAEKAESVDEDGNLKLNSLSNETVRRGILRHEIGHAIDQILGNYSHSTAFVKAYKSAVAGLSPHDRHILKYYLQPGNAGIEETFAELFAGAHGSACDFISDELLRERFANLIGLIEKKLSTIAAQSDPKSGT